MSDIEPTPHPLDERLRELADGYHRPPATPRDEMWADVQARLGQAVLEPAQGGARSAPDVVPIRPATSTGPGRRRGLTWLGAGAAAAMIALSFALGRFTGPRSGPPAATPVAPVEVAEAAGADVFRTAAAQHLVKSEELLTLVRTDARIGRVDRVVGEWGESLLVETRLLLDSPAGDDPELKPVLEDLELLLAQIALLSREGGVGGRGREELRLIAEGMDTQDMLPRIHAVLPVQAGS